MAPRLVLALFAVGCGARTAPIERGSSAPAPADLVLMHGAVWTGDPARARASALAIRGEAIAFVGGDEQAAAWIGNQTRVVDLGGRSVWPGLTDGHAHPYMLGRAFVELDLHGAASPAEVAERVRMRIAEPQPGDRPPWIAGAGWNQALWQPPALPEHAALDQAAPDRPVWLHRSDGHAGWANAVAMRLAKVDAHTPDVPGGRIVRDAAGAPTGMFVDNAMGLIERAAPQPSDQEIEEALARALGHAASLGLTGVHDMGVAAKVEAAYRRLDAAGKLPVRVDGYVWMGEAERLLAYPRPTAHGRFALRGVKLFADGAIGSGGALFTQPYADEPQRSGTQVTPPARIEAITRRALAGGWQVATHAIGDRAVHDTLDAYARALAGAPPGHLPLRIEHAAVVQPADCARFGALGVTAGIQPLTDKLWPGAAAERRLGAARLPWYAAWRALAAGGARLVLGRDSPIDRLDPLEGIRHAAERADGGSDASQRLTLAEAVAAYTGGPAFAIGEARSRGRIAPGFAADLTVLDRAVDPDGAAAQLDGAHAAMTIVAGQVVFQR